MQTNIQRITPFLWFDNQAEEAVNFYTSIFHNSKVVTHRSLILETCLKIWKFSLQRDNGVEVL